MNNVSTGTILFADKTMTAVTEAEEDVIQKQHA